MRHHSLASGLAIALAAASPPVFREPSSTPTRKRLVAGILLASLLDGGCQPFATAGPAPAIEATLAAPPADVMVAHFIDVGQADCTLLEFPTGAILVDAGSQDDPFTDKLVAYLDAFFVRRADLNKTFESVIVTHNHIDHTRALRTIAERYTVERYIDNGHTTGTGTGNPNWLRKEVKAGNRSTIIREVADQEVMAVTAKTGLTDAVIDPLTSPTCDPKIVVLSGRVDENPGWSHDAFDNKNNHSLVVRVDFGESSFLFTGDMEESAIETMLDWYDETSALDTDVYHVGHHGSHNGTTSELLQALTPELAVISCGQPSFGQPSGRGRPKGFSTFVYGHPRRAVLDILGIAIPGKRSAAIDVQAGEGSRQFQSYRVRKNIYATPWDGTLTVTATPTGSMQVRRNP